MDNSRLPRIALVAEIVSEAAVVLLILFLALETRDNTKAIHVQTHLALTEQMNGWREQLIAEEFISAWQKAREQGIDSLTVAEQERYMSRQLNL